ncbi:hypothetical protein DM01DRAFT_1335152 [Hesseltinella vesiculosa]|uniref:Uncharacterized protein n=1 Tax=Hesseltinella vesiculosa TaxID=101127 RepID=A0A1X2GKD3_9FUNG|nr:hypothetical protein DM01DRAFT_1335152 [Hesseltinella vesiculosa]
MLNQEAARLDAAIASSSIIQDLASSDEDEDSRIPSDLTNDYHPGRGDDYCLYQEDEGTADQHQTSSDGAGLWVAADGTDLASHCQVFKINTAQLRNPVEQLSDLRHLALHDIYYFDPSDQNVSTSKDWPTDLHDQAVATFKISPPPKAAGSPAWCLEISLSDYKHWTESVAYAASHLIKAIESGNMVDVYSMQAIVALLPTFVGSLPDDSLEDSYVHNFIAPVFKPIFASEPSLRVEWANGHLQKKTVAKRNQVSGRNHKDYKPDFTASAKATNSWISIVVGEFKKPGYSPTMESDFLKIGKQMRSMINDLVRQNVCGPVVCGILVQGRQIRTFKMDLVALKTYRMIKIGQISMFEGKGDLSNLPAIVSRLMQVKAIAIETAHSAKSIAVERHTTLSNASLSPQAQWLSDENFILRKRKAPNCDQ